MSGPLDVYAVACPHCHAEPGEWCIASKAYSGHQAGYRTQLVHNARLQLVGMRRASDGVFAVCRA